MKRCILLLACAGALPAQQLTLSVANAPGQIRPGTTVTITAQLTGAAGSNLAAWQASLNSSVGGQWAAAAGPASTAAAKSLASAVQTSGEFMALAYGQNANVYADGSVASFSLVIPANATPGTVVLQPSNVLGASLAGDPVPLTANTLSFVLASPLSRCDVNGDGLTNIQDVTFMLNQILGLAACSTDLNADGKCTVVDLSRVIAAALGGSCRVN